jgi:copper chaperone NosL
MLCIGSFNHNRSPIPLRSKEKEDHLKTRKTFEFITTTNIIRKIKMGKITNFIQTFCLCMICAGFILSTAPTASAQDDIKQHPACPYCGMDRHKFAHSRILINFEDGASTGTCSLHCAAIDLVLKIDKTPAKIMTGDYNTKQLIDAEKAFWVMGGDKMGVMTTRAKWAFEKMSDANTYIQEHGGELVTYENAVQGTFEDMNQDLQMIRKKRKMKRMKKMKK